MSCFRDIRAGLASVSPLQDARAGEPSCKICGAPTLVFDLVDANKCCSFTNGFEYGLCGVGVVYLRCTGCGFIFTTDFDSWPAEDFRAFIYNDDYVRVDPDYLGKRPADTAASFARRLGDLKSLSILDYGSGIGAFVNLLREAGFASVDGYDPFSNPARPQATYDLITCTEVIEHVPDPVPALLEIASLLKPDGVFSLQTSIAPANIGTIRGRWWYVAPRNGHISIFGLPALSAAARRAGLALKLGPHEKLLLHHEGTEPRADLLAALSDNIRDYMAVRLSPPGADGAPASACVCETADAWHRLEQAADGGAFRWSAADTLVWSVRTGGRPTCLDVETDLLMGVTPAHTENMHLEIGGRQVALQDSGSKRYIASALLDGGEDIVTCTLRTPPPISPLSLGRNQDARALAIALRVP